MTIATTSTESMNTSCAIEKRDIFFRSIDWLMCTMAGVVWVGEGGGLLVWLRMARQQVHRGGQGNGHGSTAWNILTWAECLVAGCFEVNFKWQHIMGTLLARTWLSVASHKSTLSVVCAFSVYGPSTRNDLPPSSSIETLSGLLQI